MCNGYEVSVQCTDIMWRYGDSIMLRSRLYVMVRHGKLNDDA